MKVFLDMDGVLVDFRRGVCEFFRRDDPATNWTFWENWEGVATRDVDDICGSHFWSQLHWTSEGIDIEQAVRDKFNTDNIYLLTTPMHNAGSSMGKLWWIEDHMPWAYNRTILSYAPKSLFATPDTLLIDDKDENIAEFVAAGGQGILVPRLWNELHDWSGETLQVVKNSLEAY